MLPQQFGSLVWRRDLVHEVGDVSPHVVERVGGFVGLPSAAVDQHAQVTRLPDGQMLGERAVCLPTGLRQYPIFLILVETVGTV